MKKISSFLALCLLAICVTSQVTNINPDPNGDPWVIGPGNELGEPLPAIIINPAATALILGSVDNSQQSYFYEIFNQTPEGGPNYNSCAQAAGVTYTFAYEINRLKNEDGNDIENIYSQCYTWNYFNGNNNDGSSATDGW